MTRTLLVLWDPENPIVEAQPIVDALRRVSGIEVREVTFKDLGHRTLPNRAFKLGNLPGRPRVDGLLWIEGGPLPGDLRDFQCPKAAWLPNSALEPTLSGSLKSDFARVFVGSLRDTKVEEAEWLPPTGSTVKPIVAPPGISLLSSSPKTPAQSALHDAIRQGKGEWPNLQVPLVICHGAGGEAHPKLFDFLAAGVAVVSDPESDLRGIAHVGEHLDVFPSTKEVREFIRALASDQERLLRLSRRGPAIYGHLHEPILRAARILDGLWPRMRVLGGRSAQPRVSILVTCYRYLKRLAWCLESLARQELPAGALEIVVADPESPDGLGRHLEGFAQKYPSLRVVHLPLDIRYRRNRGVGINRAFEVSQGKVVIGIDGDLVFPPHLVGLLEEKVLASPNHVFGVRRSFLSKENTERILASQLDPFSTFRTLSESLGDGEENSHVGVLGYCQAVHRSAFAKARYPEEFDMINQSDIVFVERLKKEAGVAPEFLAGETALHLWHPRNWMGTTQDL